MKVNSAGVVVRNKWTQQQAAIEETKDLETIDHIGVTLDLSWSEHRAINHMTGEITISKVCLSLTGMSPDYMVLLQHKKLRGGRGPRYCGRQRRQHGRYAVVGSQRLLPKLLID